MNKGIKFVFYGSDAVAKSALVALARYDLFPSERAEVAVLVSYGKILKQEEIDSYKYGVLNIHPSLLPELRGPSPIKSAILNDLERTGVSIMKLDSEVDHGPILATAPVALSPRRASESELRQALFEKGAELLAECLPKYLRGELVPAPQDHSKATYTRKFKPEDGLLEYPFTDVALTDKKVRALSEEPGTFVILNTDRGERRVKILSGKIESNKYIPTLVQPAGKNPMSWDSFQNGNKIIS